MDGPLCSLIVPSEKPPSDIDIKRALLIFDRVHLLDPTDRELFPRPFFMQAVSPPGLVVPLVIDMGPVLPLGKLPGYDDAFQRAVDDCAAAVEECALVVESAPPPTPGFGLGAVPYPPGRGSPGPLLNVFRALASKPEYVRGMCKDLPPIERLARLDPSELAPDGNALTHQVAHLQWPPVAELGDGSIPASCATTVRNLAAARLGSLLKSIDMAEVRSIHLFSTDLGMNETMVAIQRTAQESLVSLLGDDERLVVQRALRVERILADIYLPDAVLGAMSISEVLKARTKTWGIFGEKRTAFFLAIRRLSEECATDAEFDSRVTKEIESYRQASGELNDEWCKFGMRIGGTTSAALLTKEGQVLEQIFGMQSWSAALMIAALAASQLLAKEGPLLLGQWRKVQKNVVGAGRALTAPYAALSLGPARG